MLASYTLAKNRTARLAAYPGSHGPRSWLNLGKLPPWPKNRLPPLARHISCFIFIGTRFFGRAWPKAPGHQPLNLPPSPETDLTEAWAKVQVKPCGIVSKLRMGRDRLSGLANHVAVGSVYLPAPSPSYQKRQNLLGSAKAAWDRHGLQAAFTVTGAGLQRHGVAAPL